MYLHICFITKFFYSFVKVSLEDEFIFVYFIIFNIIIYDFSKKVNLFILYCI